MLNRGRMLSILSLATIAASGSSLSLSQTSSPTAGTKTVPHAASWAAAEKAVTKLEQDWFRIQLSHEWDKLHRMN